MEQAETEHFSGIKLIRQPQPAPNGLKPAFRYVAGWTRQLRKTSTGKRRLGFAAYGALVLYSAGLRDCGNCFFRPAWQKRQALTENIGWPFVQPKSKPPLLMFRTEPSTLQFAAE
jgi:hypothetical protein